LSSEDIINLIWKFLVGTLSNVEVSEVVEGLENLLVFSDQFDVEVGLVVDELELSSDEQELHSVEQEDEGKWSNQFEQTVGDTSNLEAVLKP
jgi:hypothetical protein